MLFLATIKYKLEVLRLKMGKYDISIRQRHTLSAMMLTRVPFALHFAEMMRPKSTILLMKYRGPTCCLASL